MEDTKMSSSPPPSPNDDASMRSEEAEARPKMKKPRKKRRSDGDAGDGGPKFAEGKKTKKRKEPKEGKERVKKEKRSKQHANQVAVQEQMRRALEDDRYSAVGSIVSDTDTEEDDDRLEKSDVRAAMRKRLWMMERKRQTSAATASAADKGDMSETEVASVRSNASRRGGRKKKRKKKKRSKESSDDGISSGTSDDEAVMDQVSGTVAVADKGVYEEGSIFGPTTGSSHATWVECDKCKKWRRLRGVVDETKLPSRWYCSMNKNDPERSRCSAPEEEYSETAKPDEDAADARARKHLRVWVRRLRCQEAFRDARRPMTRGGNKRSTSAGTKEPYEWIRCSACGKWRACLRFMDKSQILDRNTEWYCVMNTWDEKMASCAAPQENLPAVGCPPWVMQDDS